jgi:hypothetical protein
MSLTDGLASAIAQSIIGAGHPLKFPELISVRALTGTDTLTNQARNVQRLDTGGVARNVLLPPEEDGLFYVFINSSAGAFALTIRDDSNTTTVATVAQNTVAIVVCAGGTWVRLYTATIVL